MTRFIFLSFFIGTKISWAARLCCKVFSVATIGVLLAACVSSPRPQPVPIKSVKNQAEMQVVWQTDLGVVDYLQPYFYGHFVFVATREGAISLVNLNNGQRLWQFQHPYRIQAALGGAVRHDSATGDERFMLAFVDEKNRLNILNGLGQIQASIYIPGDVLTRPVVYQDKVYVRTNDGRVLAYDAQAGSLSEPRWIFARTNPRLTLRPEATMMVQGGTIYLGWAGGKILALSASTGKLLFDVVVSVPQGTNEVERLNDALGNPLWVPSEKNQPNQICEAFYQSKVACVDASTGKVLWSKPIDARVPLGGDGELLLSIDRESVVQTFLTENGNVLWRNEGFKWHPLRAPPLLLSRSVVLSSDDGRMYVLSWLDGRLLATWNFDYQPDVNPRLGVGSFYSNRVTGLWRMSASLPSQDGEEYVLFLQRSGWLRLLRLKVEDKLP